MFPYHPLAKLWPRIPCSVKLQSLWLSHYRHINLSLHSNHLHQLRRLLHLQFTNCRQLRSSLIGTKFVWRGIEVLARSGERNSAKDWTRITIKRARKCCHLRQKYLVIFFFRVGSHQIEVDRLSSDGEMALRITLTGTTAEIWGNSDWSLELLGLVPCINPVGIHPSLLSCLSDKVETYWKLLKWSCYWWYVSWGWLTT